jgi:hypothetical protein
LAEFRGDLESYVSLEVVEQCIGSYFELPPAERVTYSAFVDPSSGALDSFSLAISHRESDQIIIDALYEKAPPFPPEAAIAEFCEVLERWRIRKVVGDRFGGISRRAISQAQHQLRGEPKVKNRSVCRLPSAAEFRRRHAAEE